MVKRTSHIDAQACQTKRRRAHSMPLIGDCMYQLAEELRSCDGVVVIDPQACVALREEGAACTALEALSLLLLDNSSEQRTDGMRAHRLTWWGIGVLRSQQSDVAYNCGEEGVSVLWNVVPLVLTVVPWQVELPLRLRDLVLCQGHFASIGECEYGNSDVGPVPDTFVTREAVALLCGLPRCRIQAISGRFPLFRRATPSSFSAAPRGVLAADASWSLMSPREVSAAQCVAAAQRHARRLTPFLVGGLSSLMESFAPRNDRSAPAECWIAVCYPDGLPRAEAARDEVDSVCCCNTTNTSGAVPMHVASVHQSDDFCEAAPFSLLPSHLLCQSLHVAVGWQKISPSSRPLAAEALQRLCSLVDRVALRTDRGVKLTSRTTWCAAQETRTVTMTIQKASSM
ncbi:hypothetical protein Q4I28_002958 [Leishmania naiffi]|uniref:Uncharacterized protein n=1 Tax=Leishmania naiffi TaxID=5678 RepID=A0AAW3BUJ5_9TRYP